MNESTVSSAYQKKLREALPGAVVVKHADKSMIGLVDSSVTFNKMTLWIEYKLITPTTKGVHSYFAHTGDWNCEEVAASSPTQYDMAKKLASSGHCIYLFWVLDHNALRKRVAYIQAWHPITKRSVRLYGNGAVVTFVHGILHGINPLVT